MANRVNGCMCFSKKEPESTDLRPPRPEWTTTRKRFSAGNVRACACRHVYFVLHADVHVHKCTHIYTHTYYTRIHTYRCARTHTFDWEGKLEPFNHITLVSTGRRVGSRPKSDTER